MKLTFIKKACLISAVVLSTSSFAGTLTPADADIVAAIHAKFASDNSVAASKINITSHAGDVELTGKVDTDSEATKLIELAESVDHVKDVDSRHLTVLKSKHPLKDSAITAKVKGAFVREKLMGSAEVAVMAIAVETTNGVVYLTGIAESPEQIKNAVKIAKSVKGVKHVKSKVELKVAK
jgi:hyperosmotically inducible protein